MGLKEGPPKGIAEPQGWGQLTWREHENGLG